MNFINQIIIFPVKVYQKIISPILGPTCRFEPTCSHYMIDAVNEWGIFKGFYLGMKRIFRCHPWGSFGPDPVPKKDNNAQTKKK